MPKEAVDVTVLGSLNVDFTAYCLDANLPLPGQTVFGSLFEKSYGGKGANQAVQAARLGVDVRMIGRVGNADSFGKEYVAHLREEEKVLVDTVDEVDGVNTGIAHITVSSSGENSIVIVQGANGALNAPFLDEHYEYLQLGKVLLCQNEIPFASTIAGLKAGTDSGVITIWNPAPAPAATSFVDSSSSPEQAAISRELWQESTSEIFENLRYCGPLSYVVVNETELAALSGAQAPCESDEQIEYHANKLLGLCYCENVIVTLGERGCFLLTLAEGQKLGNSLEGLQQLRSPTKAEAKAKARSGEGGEEGDGAGPAYKAVNGGVNTSGQFYRCDRLVEAVDTTGAGDSFLGAFAAHLSRGSPVERAIRASLHIASCSVTSQGAQQSYVRAVDLDSQYRVLP